MRLRTLVTAVLGVAALALGFAYTFSPEVVERVAPLVAFRSWTGGYSPSTLLTSIGGLLAGYAALAFWLPSMTLRDTKPDSPTERYRQAQTEPPEQVAADDRVAADALLSDALDDAVSGRGDAEAARRHVRETVHAALLQAGRDPEAAAELLETGAWTDDTRAAAYLAEDADYSLASRLRHWLDAESEQARRLDAAVREATNVVDDATEGAR